MDETPGVVIAQVKAWVSGEVRDSEGHLLDSDGNRIEGDQE